MNTELQGWIIDAVLLFCRVGACIMLLPGFSSTRLPTHIRLFFALAVSLALLPLVQPMLRQHGQPQTVPAFALAIATELVVGALMGLLARTFLLAFQALLTASGQLIGYSSLSGSILEDGEPIPELATLISMAATILIFLTGLHWQLLRGIVDSYAQIPVGTGMSPGRLLTAMTDQLSATFVVALRITSPFFVYGVLVNFAVGLINKMVPQIPVFFIATPFILAGGMFIFYLLAPEMLYAFLDSFAIWAQGF